MMELEQWFDMIEEIIFFFMLLLKCFVHDMCFCPFFDWRVKDGMESFMGTSGGGGEGKRQEAITHVPASCATTYKCQYKPPPPPMIGPSIRL